MVAASKSSSSQGLIVLGAWPLVSYNAFSISSSMTKCSVSNPLTEISLDSVPGPASNQSVEDE